MSALVAIPVVFVAAYVGIYTTFIAANAAREGDQDRLLMLLVSPAAALALMFYLGASL